MENNISVTENLLKLMKLNKPMMAASYCGVGIYTETRKLNFGLLQNNHSMEI